MKTAMSRSSLLAVALAATLGHQDVQAQAYSSATLGNYQYTLVDLDPNDGIAPSITWGQGKHSQYLDGSLSDGVGFGGGPNSIASSEETRTYTGPIDAPHSLSYQGFGASSGPSGLSASASVQKGGQWNQSALFRNDFVLSANTAVTFTAQASVTAGVVVPDGSVIFLGSDDHGHSYYNNGYFDYSSIMATMQAVLYVGSGSPDFSSDSLHCWTGCLASDPLVKHLRTYSTTDFADTALLSITVSNQTQNVLSSQFLAAARTTGYATAPLMMVPELSASAQMILGLASLGVVAGLRRRQHHG